MTESSSEDINKSDINLHIEAVGHLRYLCVTDGEVKEKERIPLHIFNMTDEVAKHWFMKDLTRKLLRKVMKKQKRLIMTRKK